jgi:menaquinone-dependent protoporphyrinogen oxidase
MRGKISIFLLVSLVISFFALTTIAQAKGLDTGLSLKEKKVAIIYGSRYGATAQAARWIAEGMQGKAEVFSAKEAGNLAAYDLVILGSGIYGDQLQEDMLAFLEKNKGELKNKVIALFVVCGASGSYAQNYLRMFAEKCDFMAVPTLTRAFNGWLKKELLSPEDYKLLENYYKEINQPFENYDNTDKAKCLQFGKEIFEAISK